MRKLLLRNFLSPGDILMLTAAVRDLKRSHRDHVLLDVRTPCPELWENNPYLTAMREDDSGMEVIDCQYPLIHQSNRGAWHFIHGFRKYLESKLELPIAAGDFHGDIHVGREERKWMSQVQEVTAEPVPFWIIVAGGKLDFTAKWWAHDRYQRVVDHFRSRILFVQVGEKGHYHPPLRGVIDLRARTDLRQLVRLVYHAQGVLCPVSLLMHLAAAVETGKAMPKNRPCVVVAGGREPAQWEAYPHHQYIHTNGALRCCDNGGCWKSRVVPVGDGDQKDRPDKLCVDVVELATGRRQRGAAWAKQGSSLGVDIVESLAPSPFLPRCLDLISADEVIRRIELYFDGGAVNYLSATEAAAAAATVPTLSESWKG